MLGMAGYTKLGASPRCGPRSTRPGPASACAANPSWSATCWRRTRQAPRSPTAP
ncbi:hypothetical protein ACFQZ4_13110 [Catellatospora coxensis]